MVYETWASPQYLLSRYSGVLLKELALAVSDLSSSMCRNRHFNTRMGMGQSYLPKPKLPHPRMGWRDPDRSWYPNPGNHETGTSWRSMNQFGTEGTDEARHISRSPSPIPRRSPVSTGDHHIPLFIFCRQTSHKKPNHGHLAPLTDTPATCIFRMCISFWVCLHHSSRTSLHSIVPGWGQNYAGRRVSHVAN
ncbi:hypothetical protein VUR80DRAFT_4753 [Thermomyces stellatus]